MARKKKLTKKDARRAAVYTAIATFGGASKKLMGFRALMEGYKFLPDDED